MIPLSILDLAPVPEGSDVSQSLANTLGLARHAERLGYKRFWLAEHHNMPGIASAATSVVIGAVAAATKTIRVGAGGVMLPGQTTLELINTDGWLDRSLEWRQCPVKIREYDRATHALVTEFVGVVVDPTNMASDRMVFTCAGADEGRHRRNRMCRNAGEQCASVLAS